MLDRMKATYHRIIALILYICNILATFSLKRSTHIVNRKRNSRLSHQLNRNLVYFSQDAKDSLYDLSSKLPSIEFKQIVHTKPNVKIFCISDLHADSERGQSWVFENCDPNKSSQDIENQDLTFTCLILPGDICTELDRLSQLFVELKQKYDVVCYIPGNHEAWRQGISSERSIENATSNSNNRMAVNSIEKLAEILRCALNNDVCIGPVRITNNESRGVSIFPLYSWYHSSWDQEPDLTNKKYLQVEKAIPFERKWGDFSLCSWPEDLISHENFTSIHRNNSTLLAEAFGLLNEPFLFPRNHLSDEKSSFGSMLCEEDDFVISFSHFLPKQELCPEKRFLLEPLLSRVIGSKPLDEQIYRLNPHLHLFGHTHIPIDMTIDDIRYIQWPLGYSREANRQCFPIFHRGPLLIYESNRATNIHDIPDDLPSLEAVWSKYYQEYPRQPHITDDISYWLDARLDSFAGLVYSQQKTMDSSE